MRKFALARSLTQFAAALLICGFVSAAPMPWLDASRSPDERARLALSAMTLEEKIGMLHGPMPLVAPLPGMKVVAFPKAAIPSAGYIPGVPRLKIPALYETDASLGVANPLNARPGDIATALPSGLALAATFNPALAYQSGALVGAEARAKGFNVLLGAGMNLTRDPRNGRNFEYLGEDPLLSGVMAGEAIRGTQDQHVISTVKHFALNAHETNRLTLDARIDPSALRESDLLAFQLAIERGEPGSVMCAYNSVNGTHACQNAWLLNEVLKQDWKYPGWVMSDWGAVHSTNDANEGLDQESGEQLDEQVWFGAALRTAVNNGSVAASRVDNMVYRILRSMFAIGLTDNPAAPQVIDYQAHAMEALEVARQGIVLLKNQQSVLPLSTTYKRIAVIGGQAHVGVLSGGGSSQVTPANGPPTLVPIGGRGMMMEFRKAMYFPSSPMHAIQAAAKDTEVIFDSGNFPQDAASLAASADIAIVFATRHELEGYDVPNLHLPNGQDALIDAVSSANSRTIVVLETGNPVSMPWIDKVVAVIAAWYPGQEGGQAIADILFGAVNPSGRLPITFPVDDYNGVRPILPNKDVEPDVNVSVDYTEGSDVGYRWYSRHKVTPLFPFGHGLSYSSFNYQNLSLHGDKHLWIQFEVVNTSHQPGADVPQVYLVSAAGKEERRLLGFQRLTLDGGERRTVKVVIDPRLLASFDESRKLWRISKGLYQVSVGHSSGDMTVSAKTSLSANSF